MLTLKQVAYAIADLELLKGLDWTLVQGKRVALVGPNGAGKTTLLRVIAGELEPDEGQIIKSRHYRVGYLPQETITRGSGLILEFVMGGRADLLEMRSQLESLQNAPPGIPEERSGWMKRVEELENRFISQGGYELEHKSRRILSGLGFEPDDAQRALATFSGGWRMKALLARLLLGEPDLLLLDEPTNHLDLPSLEWLERFLLGYSGSMVLVSHDRFFIDRLAQEIVELEAGRLQHYSGHFREYQAARQERRERQEEQKRLQDADRRRQERFIERFRYKNTKATQVQSRIKQLDKMDVSQPLPKTVADLNFRLEVAVTGYKDVLSVDQAGFHYDDDQWVFRGANLRLFRGDKVCLVGKNGAGKTTLTRLISGDLNPCEGIVQLGGRTRIGYYAQHQVDALRLDETVYESVSSVASTIQTPRIRPILGLFGFSGDEVFKPVGVLSGGEKSRVSLARILLSGANFLIMDEPTNHLDSYARDALEKALCAYEGTLMLVSHDRYFLDRIVSRVVEIRDGLVTGYLGNYSDYLEKREVNATAEPGEANASVGRERRDRRREQAKARQSISRRRGELNKMIRELEEKIEALESRHGQLESQLSLQDTYQDAQRVVELQKEFAMVGRDLETAIASWESSHEKLEVLLSSLNSENERE